MHKNACPACVSESRFKVVGHWARRALTSTMMAAVRAATVASCTHTAHVKLVTTPYSACCSAVPTAYGTN